MGATQEYSHVCRHISTVELISSSERRTSSHSNSFNAAARTSVTILYFSKHLQPADLNTTSL